MGWKSLGYQLRYFLQERYSTWKYFYMDWVKAGEFKNKLRLLQSLWKSYRLFTLYWSYLYKAIFCLFSH